MDLLNLFYAPTREEWRAWLAEHYASESEVWLIYYKKHTGKPRVSYDDAVEEAICFGWIDSIVRKLDEDRFAQKFTPRRLDSQWSELNLRRLQKLIAEGRMTPAGMAKVGESPRPAPPRFQAEDEVPAFIEEGLRQDAAAYETFQRLPPSHRRNYVRWITEAKKEETRLRRLSEAVQRLARSEPLGMK